jgi:hypothetical protein
MVGMENEYAIHRPGQDRIDPVRLAGHREEHVQKVFGIAQFVAWINPTAPSSR